MLINLTTAWHGCLTADGYGRQKVLWPSSPTAKIERTWNLETVFTCLYQTRLSRDQRPTTPVYHLGTGAAGGRVDPDFDDRGVDV